MLFTQSPFFPAHQRRCETGERRSNYQTLFGLANIPAGNHIRGHARSGAAGLLLSRLRRHQSRPGAHRRLGFHVLTALDGTKHDHSTKAHWPIGPLFHALRADQSPDGMPNILPNSSSYSPVNPDSLP